jgi:hypothetical protein
VRGPAEREDELVGQIRPHGLLEALPGGRLAMLEEQPVETGAMGSEEVETPSARRRRYGVHPAEIIDADASAA